MAMLMLCLMIAAIPAEAQSSPPIETEASARMADPGSAALEVSSPSAVSASTAVRLALDSFLKTGGWLLDFASSCEPAQLGGVEQALAFALRSLASQERFAGHRLRLEELALQAASPPISDCKSASVEAQDWLARWDREARALMRPH